MSWNNLVAKAFLRQARLASSKSGASVEEVLLALQSGQYSSISSGDGQLISTSANGKTVTMTVMGGITSKDILEITEVLLLSLESGASLRTRNVGRFL